jgi:hypothetical protein
MKSTLISEWRMLSRARPGKRFQRRYEISRRTRNQTTIAGRFVRLALAVVFLAIGVVLVFIPGPAILFFVLAGSLLATESRILAKMLDALEVAARRIVRIARRVWRGLSVAGRMVVAALIGLGAISAGYFSWRILLGGS